MEAGKPLSKDLVFNRDFDCIMFWRYRSIIKRLKRLSRFFDNTFLASITKWPIQYEISFSVSRSQTSDERGNLIPRNFLCESTSVFGGICGKGLSFFL